MPAGSFSHPDYRLHRTDEDAALERGQGQTLRLGGRGESTHEIITITRHGRPAAVLMSADDLESLHETLHWLTQSGVRESITAAELEHEAGETTSGDDLRAEFGLPPQ